MGARSARFHVSRHGIDYQSLQLPNARLVLLIPTPTSEPEMLNRLLYLVHCLCERPLGHMAAAHCLRTVAFGVSTWPWFVETKLASSLMGDLGFALTENGTLAYGTPN